MRPASLTMRRARLTQVTLTDTTALEDTALTLDARSIARLAHKAGGDALAAVTVELASPGESARIVHVLDALPALARHDGPAFAGFLTPPRPVVSGTHHTFDNLAVLTCAELPWGAGGLLIAREAVIDMRGPLASLSPFGSTFNVVLRMKLAAQHAETEYETAVRRAGLAVADALGRVAATATNPDTENYVFDEPEDPLLPKIAYVYQVHSQGLYARTFLYGKELDGMLPTPLHPTELLSGALVSANYVYAAFKTPTWLHVNNPVLRKLTKGHGREHTFSGMVVSRGHHYSAWEKERSAELAAHQVWLQGAQGVALTWEGGGNSITDAMLTIRACERRGIKTAAVAYEMGDEDAADVILLDAVPEADALVSTGSTQRAFHLPPVARVLGGDALRMRPETGGEYVPADGPLELDNPYILYCAAGQTGFGTLAGVAY